MVRISVLYPNEPGRKFDHDYYVNKHMKLIRDRLTSLGLVRTEVDKGVAGGAPGSSAPYVAVGHVYVNVLDGFQKGIQPQMQISEIIG